MQAAATVNPQRKKMKHFNRSLRQSLIDESSEGSGQSEIVKLTDTSEVKVKNKRLLSQENRTNSELEYAKPGRSSSFIKTNKPDVDNLIREVA